MYQHVEAEVFVAIEPLPAEQSDDSLYKIQEDVKKRLSSEWEATSFNCDGAENIFTCYCYDCDKEKHGVSFRLAFNVPSYYEIEHQDGERWTEFNVPDKEKLEEILKDAYAKAVCLEFQLDSQNVTVSMEDITADDETIMEERLYMETHPDDEIIMEENLCMETHAEEICHYSEWVQTTLEKFPEANPEVLEFIETVGSWNTTKDTEYEQSPEHLFSNGLCWYFAKMLQENFGGEVMWHKFYSHIVWLSEDNIAYNAHGVFEDYGEGELLPVSVLSETEQKVFRHIGHFTDEKVLKAQLETCYNVLEYELTHFAPKEQIAATREMIRKTKQESKTAEDKEVLL